MQLIKHKAKLCKHFQKKREREKEKERERERKRERKRERERERKKSEQVKVSNRLRKRHTISAFLKNKHAN